MAADAHLSFSARADGLCSRCAYEQGFFLGVLVTGIAFVVLGVFVAVVAL